jgi:hypothetical protein
MAKSPFLFALAIFPFLGEPAMGNPLLESMQRKVDVFKREIDYDRLVSNLGTEQRYLLDWEETLRAFVDSDNTSWTAECEPSYYASGPLGTMRINVTNGTDTVAVEVHKVKDGSRSAIDGILNVAASGSTSRIVMRVMRGRCPGDFCLITGTESAPNSLYMAKGNIFTELNCLDDCSVLPIAHYIAEQMNKRNADPRQSPLSKLSLRLGTDRNQVRLGDEFAFAVAPKSLFDSEDWLVDVRPVNDEDLEYVKEETGRITYKALRRGALKITVNIMHKRTLQVKEETFVVNVN